MRRRGLLLAASLLLAACATPVATRYFTLQGEPPTAVPAGAAAPAYHVAIGPATVPEALDRQQLVLRVGPHRDVISDADRWSAPLKREIPRVIAEQVAQDLPAAGVAVDSEYGGQDADYRVSIDVLRLEAVPGGSVTFEAAWSVRSGSGVRLHEARSLFVETVQAPGVAPLVAAQAKAVAALGHEIAGALAGLRRGKR